MHDKGVIVAAPAAVGLVVLAAAMMLTCAAGELIKVGGKPGWTTEVNFTFWAAHQHFYVGDWLYFVFDKRRYSVLEVTRSSYDKCDDGEFLKNVTRGGRDVYNLTEARPYYFLSGGGYCFEGMKVSINVRHSAPPPPAEENKKATKSDAAAPETMSTLLLIMAALSSFIFKGL